MKQYQFIIMFNGYPRVVLPLGTSIEHAHARANQMRDDYFFRYPKVRRENIRVTPLTVEVDNP